MPNAMKKHAKKTSLFVYILPLQMLSSFERPEVVERLQYSSDINVCILHTHIYTLILIQIYFILNIITKIILLILFNAENQFESEENYNWNHSNWHSVNTVVTMIWFESSISRCRMKRKQMNVYEESEN